MHKVYVALILLATAAQAAEFQKCQWVLGPNATFLNRSFTAGPIGGMTLTSTGCYCKGTCSTAAQFSWQDQASNAVGLAGGGNVTCQSGATNITFTNFTTGTSFLSGEVLQFNVANAPTSTDEVLLCVRFTVP